MDRILGVDTVGKALLASCLIFTGTGAGLATAPEAGPDALVHMGNGAITGPVVVLPGAGPARGEWYRYRIHDPDGIEQVEVDDPIAGPPPGWVDAPVGSVFFSVGGAAWIPGPNAVFDCPTTVLVYIASAHMTAPGGHTHRITYHDCQVGGSAMERWFILPMGPNVPRGHRGQPYRDGSLRWPVAEDEDLLAAQLFVIEPNTWGPLTSFGAGNVLYQAYSAQQSTAPHAFAAFDLTTAAFTHLSFLGEDREDSGGEFTVQTSRRSHPLPANLRYELDRVPSGLSVVKLQLERAPVPPSLPGR